MHACLLPPDHFQNKRNVSGQLLTQFGGGTILANSGNNYSFVLKMAVASLPVPGLGNFDLEYR